MQAGMASGTLPEQKNVLEMADELNHVADLLNFLVKRERASVCRQPQLASGAGGVLNTIKWLLTMKPKPTEPGNISDWIAEFWTTYKVQAEDLGACLELLKAIGNPRNSVAVRRSLTEFEAEMVSEYLPQLRNNDLGPLNCWLKKLALTLGTKGCVEIIPNAMQMRAMQAFVRCLIYYRLPIQLLITRARRGDKDAAIDLIRIDCAFLNDPCTVSVIEDAARRNDRQFFKQVSKTFNVNDKDLVRIAIYMFSICGSALSKAELRDLLDPDWNKFRDEGFEKFVTRAREDLKQSLREADEMRGARSA